MAQQENPAEGPTSGGHAEGASADGTSTDGTGGGGPRLWSVDEHLADVLAAVGPLPPLELPLLEAQGCLTYAALESRIDLPAFDNSSMDGYAVRTADLAAATEGEPVRLALVGDVPAGAAVLPTVGPGQCARIMTGAPLPPGADAVAPVEWTDDGRGGGPVDAMEPGRKVAAAAAAADGGSARGGLPGVRFFRTVEAGAFVRRRGDDLRAGQPLLPAGTELGPAQLALLAAAGRDSVLVHPRPRVVVVSTGSELVPPGAPLGPGQIPDSNSFALTAAARDAGALAFRVGGVPDEPEKLREVIEDQLIRADLVVTSGGVSVGAYDVVKEALGEQIEFRSLRMQPGKPQGFGLVEGRVPLLALPGNPVSAYISFELFARPVIRTMLGRDDAHRPRVRAELTEALTSPAGRRQFARGSYAEGRVTPVGGAGSHLVGALARADALIVVPEDTTEVPAGTEVEVVLLH